MQAIVKYVACDGKEFSDQSECLAYENTIAPDYNTTEAKALLMKEVLETCGKFFRDADCYFKHLPTREQVCETIDRVASELSVFKEKIETYEEDFFLEKYNVDSFNFDFWGK